MKTQRKFWASSIAVFFVFSILANHSVNEAYACSCIAPDSPNRELEKSHTVFSGKVINIEEQHPTTPLYSSADPVRVTFDVDKIWKGLTDDESVVIINTAISSASCGYHFEEGQEYIVYANQFTEKLEVSLCSRTNTIENAAEDLKELGPGMGVNTPTDKQFLAPLKQLKTQADIHSIKCNENLVLIFKEASWSPACVTPESVEKLIDRGWASTHEPNHNMTNSEEEILFTIQEEDKIGLLSASSKIIKKKFDAGPMMTYVSSNSDGSMILATSSGSDAVFAFDLSHKDHFDAKSIPVGQTPKGVKVHPDGNLAFVANEGSGTISVINLNSFEVTKEFEVGKVPHNIRFDSQGDTAYVTLQGEDKIAIVDVKRLEMTDFVSVGKLPHNLDLSPDGRYLYTSNIGTSDVAVIDLQTKEVIKRIKVSIGHHGIDVTEEGKRIYVSGIGDNKINVIDAQTLELVKQIDVGQGPHGIRASEDGSRIYVGITSSDEITVIDAQTLDIIDRISVGGNPFWLSIPQNP